MSAGKFIRARLTATPAITNLVGSRIHPIVLPQTAAYPAIVYSITGEPADQVKGSAGTIDRITAQFNIWSKDYDELEQIFDALREVMDYEPGTAGTVQVQGIRIINWRDGIDEDLEYLLRQVTYTMRVIHT